MVGTHVPSPEQYLKPTGQDAILGQLLIDFLHELSLEHLTGRSTGHYVWIGNLRGFLNNYHQRKIDNRML